MDNIGTGTGRQFATIQEFCSEHRISRSFLYKLLKAGKGPRITHLGSRSYVSNEAAAAWRSAMEGATASPQAA
jgi:predicted DNA-binding transcriptional regulator AlpA